MHNDDMLRNVELNVYSTNNHAALTSYLASLSIKTNPSQILGNSGRESA